MAKSDSSSARQFVGATCALPQVKDRELAPNINSFRARLIRLNEKKWANDTVLRYYFFDRPSDGPDGSWRGPKKQRDVVTGAFATWKEQGIGLEFREVQNREDAEIRIGFEQGAGSWSYVGRDVIDVVPSPNERTMNFGWDLSDDFGWDTALHEIGHTLGFPHEHQNPNAGIVWDEQKVLDAFRNPPSWTDEDTIHNILRKIPAGSVSGSAWDKDSVMHYRFPAGLIIHLPGFEENPLIPAGDLSPVDITEVRTFYPSLQDAAPPRLVAYESQRLALLPGQQADFRISPAETRRHTIRTFGRSDAVMVLFDNNGAEPSYIDGDDDSGEDFNASITVRLERGRECLLRLRLYFSDTAGQMAIFMW